MKLNQQDIKKQYLRFTKYSKKRSISHAIFALLGIVFLIVWLSSQSLSANVKTNFFDIETKTVVQGGIVGNVSPANHIKRKSEVMNDGYDSLFSPLLHEFVKMDYLSGNLKAPLLDLNKYNPKEMDTFDRRDNMPLYGTQDFATSLSTSGFTTMALANHRSVDYLGEGIRSTKDVLNYYNISSTGAGLDNSESQKVVYQEINGMTIATLSFSRLHYRRMQSTEYTEGIAVLNPNIVLPSIATAKQNADFVIVNVHWGEILQDNPSDDQRYLARGMVDSGADIVVGHHPYSLQEVEMYNGSPIFYSLGNFIFDTGFSKHRDSTMVNFFITPDRNYYRLIPLRITSGTPHKLSSSDSFHNARIKRSLTKGLEEGQFLELNGEIWLYD